MSLFKGQSLDPLSLDCGRDISGASIMRILFEKPNGEKGFWSATGIGNVISKNVSVGDIDQSGNWCFQAHLVIAGKDFFGDIVKITFLDSLLP